MLGQAQVNMPSFKDKLSEHKLNLTRLPLKTLQINLGKLCNQACRHCHVDAGPKRTELMTKETIDRVFSLLDQSPTIECFDITGGAPELNPSFRYLVSNLYNRRKKIIDRCNLTVFFEAGQEETPHFLREHQVHVIASLPCYSQDNVDRQRGAGVFDKSIQALRLLNKLGYGQDDTKLVLDLVYNPQGPVLPPDQADLELKYKDELHNQFGIVFNNLFTITNMPIKRFEDDLRRSKKLEAYRDLLEQNFNPDAARAVMCRSLISLSWDGKIYDCDFNQMLELPIANQASDLWTIDSFDELLSTDIALANHCYGCTAGAGSSCDGAIV